jgi:autophagy-related protein 18
VLFDLSIAICALSPSSDPCYLAYPSPVPSPNSPFSSNASQNSPGDVLIFDLLSLSVTNIIQAHKTPISSLALNSTGSLLATASDKGTVIRVFSVPGAQKLYQFRRGTYNAKIYSIAFNAVSSLLAVSSDSETVHIFKVSSGGGGSNLTTSSKGNNRLGGGASSPSLNSVESSETGSPTMQSRGAGGYEAFIDDKKKSGGLR